MQRAIPTMLSTARNLGLYYYSSPQAAMSQALDWGSWLSLTWKRIYLIGHVEVRIAREGARRSNLKGLDQGHLHPLHRASETEASQSGIEPGEHSMQRAIWTALLTAIRNLGLNKASICHNYNKNNKNNKTKFGAIYESNYTN